MTERTVDIGGRSFRIVVDDAQMDELQSAVTRLDAIASDVVRSNPQIDSQYLLLLSGILLANSIDDLTKTADTANSDVDRLKHEHSERARKLDAALARNAELEAQIAYIKREGGTSDDDSDLADENARLREELATLRAQSDEVDPNIVLELVELRENDARNKAERQEIEIAINRLEAIISGK